MAEAVINCIRDFTIIISDPGLGVFFFQTFGLVRSGFDEYYIPGLRVRSSITQCPRGLDESWKRNGTAIVCVENSPANLILSFGHETK